MTCRIQYDYKRGYDPNLSNERKPPSPSPPPQSPSPLPPNLTSDPITCATGTFLKDGTCFSSSDFYPCYSFGTIEMDRTSKFLESDSASLKYVGLKNHRKHCSSADPRSCKECLSSSDFTV